MLRHEGGVGRGTGDVEALLEVALPQEVGHRRATDGGREAELIAAGHEDAVDFFENRQPLLAFAVAAVLDRQRFGMAHSEILKDAHVFGAGLLELRSRGDDGDSSFVAAANLNEAAQDRTVADPGLGAADGG